MYDIGQGRRRARLVDQRSAAAERPLRRGGRHAAHEGLQISSSSSSSTTTTTTTIPTLLVVTLLV